MIVYAFSKNKSIGKEINDFINSISTVNTHFTPKELSGDDYIILYEPCFSEFIFRKNSFKNSNSFNPTDYIRTFITIVGIREMVLYFVNYFNKIANGITANIIYEFVDKSNNFISYSTSYHSNNTYINQGFIIEIIIDKEINEYIISCAEYLSMIFLRICHLSDGQFGSDFIDRLITTKKILTEEEYLNCLTSGNGHSIADNYIFDHNKLDFIKSNVNKLFDINFYKDKEDKLKFHIESRSRLSQSQIVANLLELKPSFNSF